MEGEKDTSKPPHHQHHQHSGKKRQREESAQPPRERHRHSNPPRNSAQQQQAGSSSSHHQSHHVHHHHPNANIGSTPATENATNNTHHHQKHAGRKPQSNSPHMGPSHHNHESHHSNNPTSTTSTQQAPSTNERGSSNTTPFPFMRTVVNAFEDDASTMTLDANGKTSVLAQLVGFPLTHEKERHITAWLVQCQNAWLDFGVGGTTTTSRGKTQHQQHHHHHQTPAASPPPVVPMASANVRQELVLRIIGTLGSIPWCRYLSLPAKHVTKTLGKWMKHVEHISRRICCIDGGKQFVVPCLDTALFAPFRPQIETALSDLIFSPAAWANPLLRNETAATTTSAEPQINDDSSRQLNARWHGTLDVAPLLRTLNGVAATYTREETLQFLKSSLGGIIPKPHWPHLSQLLTSVKLLMTIVVIGDDPVEDPSVLRALLYTPFGVERTSAVEKAPLQQRPKTPRLTSQDVRGGAKATPPPQIGTPETTAKRGGGGSQHLTPVLESSRSAIAVDVTSGSSNSIDPVIPSSPLTMPNQHKTPVTKSARATLTSSPIGSASSDPVINSSHKSAAVGEAEDTTSSGGMWRLPSALTIAANHNDQSAAAAEASVDPFPLGAHKEYVLHLVLDAVRELDSEAAMVDQGADNADIHKSAIRERVGALVALVARMLTREEPHALMIDAPPPPPPQSSAQNQIGASAKKKPAAFSRQSTSDEAGGAELGGPHPSPHPHQPSALKQQQQLPSPTMLPRAHSSSSQRAGHHQQQWSTAAGDDVSPRAEGALQPIQWFHGILENYFVAKVLRSPCPTAHHLFVPMVFHEHTPSDACVSLLHKMISAVEKNSIDVSAFQRCVAAAHLAPVFGILRTDIEESDLHGIGRRIIKLPQRVFDRTNANAAVVGTAAARPSTTTSMRLSIVATTPSRTSAVPFGAAGTVQTQQLSTSLHKPLGCVEVLLLQARRVAAMMQHDAMADLESVSNSVVVSNEAVALSDRILSAYETPRESL